MMVKNNYEDKLQYYIVLYSSRYAIAYNSGVKAYNNLTYDNFTWCLEVEFFVSWLKRPLIPTIHISFV